MTVRRFKNSGWQADFYAGTERIRKIFPTKKEAKDYESKIKTEIRENRYWNIQREEFETFSAMLDWYLGLPQAKRKKSYAKPDYRNISRTEPPRNAPTARLVVPYCSAVYG